MEAEHGIGQGRSVVGQVLDRLDACIYVTDLETDEILFINEKMKREFGVTGDIIGKRCWEVLQEGFSGRCEFCPKYQLVQDPDTPVVWEELNTVTGRYYRNTDCVVCWEGNRPAHMQHSVDIHEMKRVEQVLHERLTQQRLMSTIAHSFAGAGDFDELAERALARIGEFMGADIAYMLRDLPAEQSLRCMACWSPTEFSLERGSMISYAERPALYEASKRRAADAAEHIHEINADEFLPGCQWGVITQITVPLFAGGNFWGCLGIAARNRAVCDESASQLAQLLGGVFSVALERREAELRLFSAEETLRAVIDNVSLGIFWKGTDSRFVGGNPALAAMIGIHPDELAGKMEYDFLTEASAIETLDEDREVIESGKPINVETLITFKDGREVWMHITKSLVRNEAGEPVSLVGIIEDITKRKRNELQLRRMSLVIENAPQHIAYINRDGQFDYFNPITEEVTGYSKEELMAGGISLLYSAETNRLIREELIPRIYEQGKHTFEVPLVRKNGEVRYMSFCGFLVGDEGHNCATIAADVTDRRQLEVDLVREKDAAVRANEAKTEFLSRMSHEIRTPMNAIIGMTDIARSSGEVEKIHTCLEKIDVASKHLLGIINDILDMAKIEAHRLEIVPHNIQLERLVMEAMSVVTFLGEEKRQTMMVRLDRRLPRVVGVDEMRLKQIITNLLSNAVKFTDVGGEIHLNVEPAEWDDEGAKILFEVVDSGIGMDEVQLSRLFTPFEQGDGSITRRYGGTGLGLAICRQLVELMGGKIWVESEPGKGSTFRFTIRVTVPEGAAGQDSRRKYANARILAVDDSPEIRDYFTYVLEDFPVECDLAANGLRAVEIASKVYGDGGRYNAIFVDWDMPGMNGVEASRRLREIVGEDTIIIMISSFRWDAIEPEAKAAGIRQFIPKPLFPSALLEAIYSPPGTREPTPRTTPRRQSLVGYRLLLAEDVEVNREIIMTLLESTGVQLTCAETGRQAVDIFTEEQGRFDLILMDIHMPEMDGHEATRTIRAMELSAAASVPIIAMTADAFREDVEKCRQSGMNGHIAKPISRDDLFAVLSRYLSGRPKFAASNAPTAPAVAAAVPPAPAAEAGAAEQDSVPVVQMEEGVARLLGNRKLYVKLLASARVRDLTDRLMQAAEADDREKARQIAHELKGVSANLSLTALCRIVTETELRFKGGNRADDLLPALTDAAERTIRAIAEICAKEG